MNPKQVRSNLSLALAIGLLIASAFSVMPEVAHAQGQPGDLFVSNNLGGTFHPGGSSIYRYAPSGPPPTIFASGLASPRGVAFDNSSNLFVTINAPTGGTDCNDGITVTQGSIFKINSGGVTPFASNIVTGFIAGLATDRFGNVFVTSSPAYDPCDPFIGQNVPTPLFKVTPEGTVSSIAMLPATGWGVAIDVLGNLYVATSDGTGGSNSHSGEILKFTPEPDGSWTQSTFVGPTSFPWSGGTGVGPIGMAFDAAGNLFVSAVTRDASAGEIRKFDPNGVEIMPRFATGVNNRPRGLAFDKAGNLFVAETGVNGTLGHGDILQFTPGGTRTFFDDGSSGDFGTSGNRGPEELAFYPGSETSTTTGSNVTVNAGAIGFAAIDLNFSNVTTAGTTTVTPISPNTAGTLPAAFELAGTNLAFDITTTAISSTPIIVGFQVPSLLDASQLTVWHNEGGVLVNRTLQPGDSGYPSNATPNTVYASVNSLSPFVIAKARVPTNINQCKNGGWQTGGRANGTRFKNQGDCIQYVNTGK